MDKKHLSTALGKAFKVLSRIFAVFGVLMIAFIFISPRAMEIGIQGLSINAAEISLDDRIILACFVAVTMFLIVISTNHIGEVFRVAGLVSPYAGKLRLIENSGYIIAAWAVFSIGEKISLPFFNILVENDRLVEPFFGESVILLLAGLFIVLFAILLRDEKR